MLLWHLPGAGLNGLVARDDMAEFPAIPLWTDAYLADTTHLSTLEHGAYLLLLITMWRAKGQKLPDDDKRLARFTRMTPTQWRRVRPTLEPFLIIENGWITQGRLQDEFETVKRKSDSQRDKARAKWRKHREKQSATAPAGQCPDDASLPTPTPITTAPPKKAPQNGLDQAMEIWSEVLGGTLPAPTKATEARSRNFRKRFENEFGSSYDAFRQYCQQIRESPFLCGANDRGWLADFDWAMKPANLVKVVEGNYQRAAPQNDATNARREAMTNVMMKRQSH